MYIIIYIFYKDWCCCPGHSRLNDYEWSRTILKTFWLDKFCQQFTERKSLDGLLQYLNAQCAERGRRNREKVIIIKIKKKQMVQSQSEYRWVFRCLWNATKESASLIVCGRAFQSLGAELEKALKPNSFFLFFLSFSSGEWVQHIGEWVPAIQC